MRASEILEHKKSRRAKVYNLKPRNPVAHAAQSVISGSGAHKDMKKAQKQGYEKHKKPAEVTEGLLDRTKRQQIIHFLAKKMDWEINYLELASDQELITWYKRVQAGKDPMREGRHGYDDYGMSLAPGHDEGEPVYNPRYDVVGRGNDRHWQPDRDQYTPRREKKGFVFYNVKDPQKALQVGLKQTKGGKWYAFTTDRFLNKSAEREFGPGKVWYPKD